MTGDTNAWASALEGGRFNGTIIVPSGGARRGFDPKQKWGKKKSLTKVGSERHFGLGRRAKGEQNTCHLPWDLEKGGGGGGKVGTHYSSGCLT